MRNATGRAAVILLFGFAASAPSVSGQSLAADCIQDSGEALHDSDEWRALRPGEVRARLASLRESGKWSTLPDSLRIIYSRQPASFSQLSDLQRATINAALDSLRGDLERAQRDPSKFAAVKERFRLAFDFGPPVTYTLFANGPGAAISVGNGTPPVTRRSVCWLSMAAQDLTRQAQAVPVAELARVLTALDEEWDNFMNRGYSMLPHEVLINGYMPRRKLTPPTLQLIVLHPSVGTQIVSESWTHLRDSHREDVLALEPIGILRYGSHHRSFRGVSWLVTFPSASRLGSGVMVHAGRLAQLAYVVRPRDPDGKRRNGLMMSVDVYRYLSDAAEIWKAKKAAAIAACKNAAVRQDCTSVVQ